MPPPLTAYELYNSRVFTVGKDTVSGKLLYVCHGTGNDADAKAKILLEAPLVYPGVNGLVRGDVNVRTMGGFLWYGDVDYIPDYAPSYPGVGVVGPFLPPPAAPTLNQPLSADFAFDLSAQTEKVYQSILTISKTKRGLGVAPDTKGAIGVTADGDVKGCDRFRPLLEWSTSKTFDFITMDYIYKLADLVGTTNNAAFYGGDTGTQLFIGASGNTKDLNKCVVTFKFLKGKHRTNIKICDGPLLEVPSKKAWEYLWVSYKNIDEALKVTQQPDAAYVEKIYEEGNYALMGIG